MILPFKNAGQTISDSIHSICAQLFESWELILIDDSSTDHSADEVCKLSKHDQRISIYQNKGAGIVDALNTGLSYANGEFIARMDADDVMHEDRLSLQYKYLCTNQDVGVVSSLVKHTGDSSQDSRGFERYVDWSNGIMSNEGISINRFIESPISHPTVMFRKKLISKYGHYLKGPFPEDYELWLRLLHNGVKFAKINRSLLDWKDHLCRLSRTDKRYARSAFQRIKARYVSLWIKQNLDHEMELHAWGFGKVARRQVHYLQLNGVTIKCFYEVDPNKIERPQSNVKVLSIEEIPPRGKAFMLVLIGSMGIREEIGKHLTAKGYRNGKDFLHLA
ncbi:MAG: glycosyltransferase family 2 protein [Opitutales bacterium]|nr:glycosyltransferase family 2 protein [Opitutales bacterium]